MQQPQTANQVLRMYAPKTFCFLGERNLNARTILLFLFSQLHKSPNSEEFAKTLSNTHVKILLFPRLFALYCGVGGVLSSFFFTFITKKMSFKDHFSHLIQGLILGSNWFSFTRTAYEKDLILCVEQDFRALTDRQLESFSEMAMESLICPSPM